MLDVGRPSGYSDEVASVICARLATGEPLSKICKDESMPCLVSVYSWLQKREEFAKLYAQAREDQADTLAAEIIEIADTPMLGIKTVEKINGTETTEGDMIEHRRLQVDARKWVAAKLKPKKYGDSTAVKLGGDPDNPTPVSVTVALNFDEVVSKLKK